MEQQPPIITNPSFQNMSSTPLLEDAESALENLAIIEVRLIKETEELFKKQVDHLRSIDQLQGLTPDMKKIDADAKTLAGLVDSSSDLVEDVCSKMGRIDLAKARLDDCLSRVSDILDLKICRNSVLKALDQNNYEEAAVHVKRFLSIDQTELRKSIAIIFGQQCEDQTKKNCPLMNFDSDTDVKPEISYDDDSDENAIIDPKYLELALHELEEARGRLLKLCKERFLCAIKEDNIKDIERFFKIFPLLDEHQDGLQTYSEYLANKMVDSRVDEIFKSKQINQADKLAALYESIARIIDQHQPQIDTYYGPGNLTTVVRFLQNECGRLSRKILEEFRNETKLAYVVKTVKRSSLQTATQASMSNLQAPIIDFSPSKLDPRDIDNILNEITLIISRSEVYLNFIIQRLKGDVNSKCENDAQKQASLLELHNLVYVECELYDLVQQVSAIYILIEEFYLHECSKKAIVMDRIDVENSTCFVSSMLDDIFFIIKKCTKRALSTKNNQVFCAIINNCTTLLDSTLRWVLEDRLKTQQYYSPAFTSKYLDLSQAYSAFQSGRYLQSATELEISKAQYFSALNNLDKACDYIQTLKNLLDVDIRKLKPTTIVMDKQQNNQMEKSLYCLNELSQLTGKFVSIINSSLYHLFNTSIRNRLRSELKTIMNDDPDITSLDEIIVFAENLLNISDPTLLASLTKENQARLVSITKDFLASHFRALK